MRRPREPTECSSGHPRVQPRRLPPRYPVSITSWGMPGGQVAPTFAVDTKPKTKTNATCNVSGVFCRTAVARPMLCYAMAQGGKGGWRPMLCRAAEKPLQTEFQQQQQQRRRRRQHQQQPPSPIAGGDRNSTVGLPCLACLACLTCVKDMWDGVSGKVCSGTSTAMSTSPTTASIRQSSSWSHHHTTIAAAAAAAAEAARQAKSSQVNARQVKPRQCMVMQGKPSQAKSMQGKARQGKARQGKGSKA